MSENAVMEEKETSVEEEAGLLTRVEIARALKVSTCSVDLLTRRQPDPMPFMKVGRRHLFDLTEVKRWAKRAAVRSRKVRGR